MRETSQKRCVSQNDELALRSKTKECDLDSDIC